MPEHSIPEQAQSLLDFWFGEENQKKWFKSTSEFDLYIHLNYSQLWQQGLLGQLNHWQDYPYSALALVILLDQFPLNMYRNTEKAFATEQMALQMAKNAINKGFDKQVKAKERGFFYLPFMHSENLDDQNDSVQLFEQAGLDTYWPKHHQKIIQQFGRFPHRNAILGRQSTAEETAWLESDRAFKG